MRISCEKEVIVTWRDDPRQGNKLIGETNLDVFAVVSELNYLK